MASTLAALLGSVMSCLTTALPVLSRVHPSLSTARIMRSGVIHGEPHHDRSNPASSGPMSM